MSASTETRCTTCGRTANSADHFCGHCGARLDASGATPAGETTGAHGPHADRILTALRSATLGEYDIAGELGRGGMAVVFLAHDLSLNRKVAIKALLPELLYTEGMDRRFKHEARIAAKLDHPNILVIHSVREANDLLFIVMKLVEGLPLSAIVRVAGPLPIPVVRFIIRHVADALAYAHGEGVVHRDVKPANIMVDRRGNVIVMDFGIAKAADDSHLTRTGLVIGTPAYMSPEQCLAQGVSPASDQYSLGVVTYELLTGRTPFGGSPLEMQWAHATTSAPPLHTLRPDCPPELDALVMRMLSKAPADRWASLHDVAHAVADDSGTTASARSTLVRLVSEAPGLRGGALPSTPASPVPIGTAPAVAGTAVTRPADGANVAGGNVESSTPAVPAPPPAPRGVPQVAPPLTLSQQRIVLTTGDSVELVVELGPGDRGAADAAIDWTSSDPGIAVVSPNGFVTAVRPGFAEIACAWRGKRAVCVVHVAAAERPTGAPAPSVAPAPVVASTPAVARASVLASVAPRSGRLRQRWWIGLLAAGVAGAALYLGARGTGNGVAQAPRSGDAASAEAAPPATPSAPTTSPASTPPATPAPPPLSSTPTSAPASAIPNTIPKRTSTAPPTVPLARPDSGRVAPSGADTGKAYAASQPGPPAAATSPPPASASPTYTSPPPPRASPADATPTPARDKAAERLPAPTGEVASALFNAFATAVNGRMYSRITSAYSEPSGASEVQLWRDFLIFVRDYTPRATVRSTTVDPTTDPPTITATIEFRWEGDAGFDRRRQASFAGIGIEVPSGWQLHRVRLAKKFW